MQKNIGKTDKMVRLVVGVLVVLTGFVFNSWWGAIGLIPIVTALAGTCPLYLPFGINTCPVTPPDQQPPVPPQA